MGQVIAHIGRREKSRLRLELRARLDIVGGIKQCLVTDISKTGARIEVDTPPRPGECCMLLADTLECFGTVVWRSNTACGLRFDEEIRDGQLIGLRHNSEVAADVEKREVKSFARKWARGR